MATKTINIIIHSANHTPTAAGWNKILHTATGAVPLNFSDGTASPFTLNISAASTSNLSNFSYAGGDKHGIPQDVIRGTGPYVATTARAMTVSKSGGDNTVTSIGLWGASAVNDATRATRWTVGATNYDHDDRNYGDAAPVVVDTSAASYPISVSAVKVASASFGYPNVLLLTVNIPDPAQTITSVNGGAGVRIGSAGNTAQTSGFSTAPTSGTHGGEPITITGFDSGTGVVTFNGPTVFDAEVFPDPDSNQAFVLTNGSQTATLTDVPIDPPSGSTPVTVSNPDNVDRRKLGYHIGQTIGVTSANGDKFYGLDSQVSWSPDTGGTAAVLPVTTTVVYWDQSTSIAYILTVTIPPDGEIIVTSSFAIALTARALVARALTARGLN